MSLAAPAESSVSVVIGKSPLLQVAEEPAYGVDVSEAIAQDFQSSPSALSFLDLGLTSPYTAQHSFQHALAELRDKLDAVLQSQHDPEELEHQAILFWPALSGLHPWLGKGRRESELITHFDMLRAQFRLRPVNAAALAALRTALHKAATASHLSEDLVDECLDLLEQGGADLRFPLSFGGPHED